MKVICPGYEEIERTKEIIKKIIIKNEELKKFHLKSDVILLTCVFEKIIKVTVNEIDISPLYCVCLPGLTWLLGVKYIGIQLQTFQDEDLILLSENKITGGISSVLGEGNVQSDENKKLLYIDAKNLYGWAMSESLPYNEIKFDKKN